jgi:hypothetical protein
MNDKNEEYAKIELKHIQLELQNNRTQHLRSFVDQYYCYKHGFVNRNGGAKWEALVWKGVVSVEARKLKDEISTKVKSDKLALEEVRKKVVKEHVVPLKVITNLLEGLTDTSTGSIAAVLDEYILFGTITKDEDKKLRKAGLNSKMPTDDEGNEWDGNDRLARYRAVGIALEKTSPEIG